MSATGGTIWGRLSKRGGPGVYHRFHPTRKVIMKIEATCDTCNRAFLLSQIGPGSDAPGRCPFCGAGFGRHYSSVLVQTIEDAERAATDCVTALGRLQSMETGFQVDIHDVMRTLQEQVLAHEPERAVGT